MAPEVASGPLQSIRCQCSCCRILHHYRHLAAMTQLALLPCHRLHSMPWGADPKEFPATAAKPKEHPGTLLITGELAGPESHLEVGRLPVAQEGWCSLACTCWRVCPASDTAA